MQEGSSACQGCRVYTPTKLSIQILINPLLEAEEGARIAFKVQGAMQTLWCEVIVTSSNRGTNTSSKALTNLR